MPLALLKLLFSPTVRFRVALAAAIVAATLTLYAQGKRSQAFQDELKAAKQLNATLTYQLKTQAAAARADQAEADAMEQKLQEYDNAVRKLTSKIKEPYRSCLSADDTKRMLEGWDKLSSSAGSKAHPRTR